MAPDNKEQGKDFHYHLLECLHHKINIKVLNILQNYYQTESSVELKELRDRSQATLLHYAAEYGNSEIIEYLLNCLCDINAQDMLGRTPLMLAVVGRHGAAFEVLLKANADIHITNKEGENVLQMIFKNEQTYTPLRMTNLEISCGKEIYSTVITKLFHSATWRRLIEDIVSTDSEMEIIDKFGNTPKVAVKLENDELIEILHSCENEDEILEFDNDSSLLHVAVRKRMKNMVKVLIKCGADVDAFDDSEATPLFYLCTCEYMNNDTAEFLEILEMLVSRANLLTTSSDCGSMQIFNALLFANSDAIKIIMRSNIDLTVPDNKGNTALHYLVRNTNINLFELIRGRKFNVNSINKYGYTPLSSAVECDSINGMTFLLENGANVDEANDMGETLLFRKYVRFQVLNKRTVEILLEFGADPQVILENAYDLDICTIFDIITIIPSSRIPVIGNSITLEEKFLDRAKPILARLAIIQESGSIITELTLQKIYQHDLWVKYFEKCLQQLQKMKTIVVYGDVKILEFLTESDAKILAYLRNKKLASSCERHIGELEVNSPYPDLLRSRLKRMICLAKLIEKATNIVCRAVYPKNILLYSIGENIVKYLNYCDKDNLVLTYDE